MRLTICSLALVVTFYTSSIATPVDDNPKPGIGLPAGTLTGVVRDRSGMPAEGLTVRLKGTVRGLTTNQAGQFRFQDLPEGNYTVIVSGVGVLPHEQTLTIRRRETTALDVVINESVAQLTEIKIIAAKGLRERETLPSVTPTAIFAGKKTEVINLSALDANLVTNNTRQIFSKTPGVMVWENDGSGVQVGVSVRGLSPNRSWEFNVRQNGVDISSDPFGYPEAYYNPPMEAVDRIELVRGGASLQYGPQFGGLLNYVLKPAAQNKPFSLETQQTVGSYGLFSTYNRISGTVGRLQYNAYAHYRRADGWRENSGYGIFNGYASLSYAVTNRLRLTAELTRMYNESQQPGGLTDAQFAQDARQSSRARNWFSTPWTVPVLTAEYAISDQTRLTANVHGLIADRNSIGFTSAITTPDIPNAAGQFANRQIDRDLYRNWGSELRLVTGYTLFGRKHNLSTGVKYFDGHTQRQQQGRGDTGRDFNLNLQTDRFPRDLSLSVTNVAFFAENLFRITNRWTVTPGLRVESLTNDINGRFSLNANGTENLVSQQSSRRFVLAGIGTEYKLAEGITLYGNASQAYRPVLFSDLTPAAVTDFVVDPNLRDARGYTLDAGLRGAVGKYLNFDIGYFHLNYNDRIGTLTLLNAANRPYQLRTNVGRSVSQGVEAYVEFDPVVAFAGRSKVGYLSLFASVGYTDARYRSLRTSTVANGQVTEISLGDRRVENAPELISRFGANYTYKTLTVTALLNRVGMAYSDANNTITPSANAQTGVIPAYQVVDLSASFDLKKRYTFRAGVNNLTDARYFTRRAGGYPGPGILPADGRTGYLSVGLRL
ncbi:TonB-dependent receptor [Spirosoma montaniterrae]|uniref:TonB-dependent receptor n=1 Tax=Spirosoma montaniterrae TaxID=1178516 RepID=A0A1P9X1T0_9BACT|nr:TonB-dependent receptor [Spirosoma montaniterrae]AQG81577.1 TonB-dependent receptor [Spirosoma montaniterrae]